MRHSTRNAVLGAFGALVLAGLGFGAGQALAAPLVAEGLPYCTKDEAIACNEACAEALGAGYRGRCTKTSLGTVSCECVPIFP